MFNDLENANVLFERLMQLDENNALRPSGEIVPDLVSILFEVFQFSVEVHMMVATAYVFDLSFWDLCCIHFWYLFYLIICCLFLIFAFRDFTLLFLTFFFPIYNFFIFPILTGLLLFVFELLFVAYFIILTDNRLDFRFNIWVQFFYGCVQNVEAFLDAPFLVFGLTRDQEAGDPFS